ncbi:MAG: FliH/SctL family protein [Vulcanimicrobiota bacterium]
MSLIKKNRSVETPSGEGVTLPSLENAPPPPPRREGVIFRSRTEHKPAEPPPEEPKDEGAGFEGGLPGVVKDPPISRVVNGRTTMMSHTLAPLPTAVRVPTGGAEPEPAHHGGHQSMPTPEPQVVYQAPAVPVDEAIIAEAQAKAQAMMQEAQAAANQMLMEYQQQAGQMMEQANQQIQAAAEQVQRQAQEIGFQQGYEQGLQQGGLAAQQQVYQQLMESRDIFIQAIKQRHLMMASAEPEMARLAVKLAEKLMGQELAQNPDAILGVVRLALSGIGDREQVSIRVNPVDYEKVVEHRPQFERMVEGLKKFEILADASIDPGGTAIETNLGNIDARLNTRVTALLAGMNDEIALREKEIHSEVEEMDPGVPDLPPPPGEGEGYDEASPDMGESSPEE